MPRPRQLIGWRLTPPQLRIAATVRCEDLATDLMRGVDATAHSVAINPVGLPKTLATEAGPAWAEAGSAAAGGGGSVAAAAVAVVAEVVEEAVAGVAEAVADGASWRFGPIWRILLQSE